MDRHGYGYEEMDAYADHCGPLSDVGKHIVALRDDKVERVADNVRTRTTVLDGQEYRLGVVDAPVFHSKVSHKVTEVESPSSQ